MLLAQVPTTVIVDRAKAEAEVKVEYDGAPEFKPIESTSMSYATNTADKISRCWRPVLFVFPGRVVHVYEARRSLENCRFGSQGNLHDPRELSGLQHYLRNANHYFQR